MVLDNRLNSLAGPRLIDSDFGIKRGDCLVDGEPHAIRQVESLLHKVSAQIVRFLVKLKRVGTAKAWLARSSAFRERSSRDRRIVGNPLTRIVHQCASFRTPGIECAGDSGTWPNQRFLRPHALRILVGSFVPDSHSLPQE